MQCKSEKWSLEQIEILIDNYKSETCLYATSLPSYHNKHLRGEALARVFKAVLKCRPSTTIKECSTKFHNIRNQFNIEHSKVRASHKSGTGTDNIYRPSLWYYDKLMFLESYLQPRKSRNSWKNETGEGVLSQLDTTTNSQENARSLLEESSSIPGEDANSIFQDDFEVHPEQDNLLFPQVVPLTFNNQPTSVPPSLNDSILSEASCSRTKASKRKRQDSSDENYIAAIHELAKSIQQPITLVDKSSTASSCDPVEPFMNFVGSLLRSFKNEQLKLDVMNSITQLVVKAKSTDLEKIL